MMTAILRTELIMFLLIGMIGGAALSTVISSRIEQARIEAISDVLVRLPMYVLSEVRV